MLLCLLSLAILIFTVHARLQQQLVSDTPVDHPNNLKFSLGDIHPLLSSDGILKTRPTTVYRPRSLKALHSARTRSLHTRQCSTDLLQWDVIQVLGPDIEDRRTLAQLARMSGNAYALPGRSNWYQVDEAWNKSFPFGWEDPADGFRGHVFLSKDNSTIVLSIKGTTITGSSSRKDRFNDNLLFSCCCARVDLSWIFRTVCDCYAGRWRCDNTCLSDALIDDSLFYSIGVKLIEDLVNLYPHANIWLTGHSLGGALASLLGATYGFPAVAFESPGERLASSRLHLPLPPPPPSTSPFLVSSHDSIVHPAHPHLPITHVYHTSDPIPQGACTGIISPCAQAGYALETRCHLGKSIVFDTVGKLGWHVDVRTHVIKAVIKRLLEDDEVDWSDPEDENGDKRDWWESIKYTSRLGLQALDRKKREVPKAIVEEDCMDCFKWEFGKFKNPADDGGDEDGGGDKDDDDIPEPPDPDWPQAFGSKFL